MSARLLALAVVVLPGCFTYDGRYVIRGRVLGGSRDAVAPIAGATVSAGGTKQGTAGAARTGTDGSYELQYWFGGMFPFVAGTNPKVEYDAPGYQTRRVVLKDRKSTPEVTRRPCEPARDFCWVLDVVLEPAGPVEGRPAR